MNLLQAHVYPLFSHGNRWVDHSWELVQVRQWRIQDFPLGRAHLRRRQFSAETNAKAKELGPAGGGGVP